MNHPARIVIADDEPDVRLLLKLQLTEAGHEVVAEAANGDEALRACEEHDADVIVLDLLMPVRNGFEVIPELERDHPEIAVIAYTAVAGDFVRKEMERMGVPLVLKSGKPTALLEAIATHRAAT